MKKAIKIVAFFAAIGVLSLCGYSVCALQKSQTDSNEPDVYYGDVDLDGKVTMLDVVMIQKNIVKLCDFTSDQKMRGDVSGDGEISMMDVVLVQKYVADIITHFPVEGNKDTQTDTVGSTDTAITDSDTNTEKPVTDTDSNTDSGFTPGSDTDSGTESDKGSDSDTNTSSDTENVGLDSDGYIDNFF